MYVYDHFWRSDPCIFLKMLLVPNPSFFQLNMNLEFRITLPFFRSMYFDEDGDLAHEFYEEIKKGGKRKMRRVEKNLTPQVCFKILIV